MNYQNRELTDSLFFVSNDGSKLKYVHELENPRLNSQIYFCPSSYPRINRLDSRFGSCFADWYVPTEGQIFNIKNNIVSCNDVITDLSLVDYKALVDQEIQKSVKELYNKHPGVINLLYSGSSDSTVVLSYIIKMGLASRTRLVCITNTASTHPDNLTYNQQRIDRINNFFHKFGNQFADTVWETSGIDDIVNLINQGLGYFHLQNYNLSALFTRYQNQIWTSGMHGNRTLLHHWIFLDQHRILFPESIAELEHNIETKHKHVYSYSIRRMDFNKDPVPLKYVTQCLKSVHMLSGWQGNVLHMPLADGQIFQHLRRLNIAEVDFNTVADAQFAKDLIAKNCLELLEWMDQQQTSHDLINIELVSVPTANLDYDQLTIPTNLNHDPDGLYWLEQQIQKSKIEGTIEINTLMSIKNLQLIDQKLNG